MMAIWILVALAAGGLAGYLLGRSVTGGTQARIEELERALAENRKELDDYRQRVNRHFQKTAELFEDMTERYRDVYRHLATSARDLCEEQPPALRLAGGETPAIDGGNGERPETEGAPEPVHGEATPETTAEAGGDEDMLGDAPHVPERPAGETEADREDQAPKTGT